jgi:Replication-relaxation
MRGNEHRGMVVQERERHAIRELNEVMRVIDRELFKIVAGFTSTTRANARLLALTRAGLLLRFFLGTTGAGQKALYASSLKGAQFVGVPLRAPRRRKDEMLVADFVVQHQLTVNEIYCAVKYRPMNLSGCSFRRWVAFHEPLFPGLRLIPDGYAEWQTPSGVIGAFLEIDLGHEGLAVWKEKVKNYLELVPSGEFERRFSANRFRVLVIAPSDRRLRSIRKTIAAATPKFFWFASLEAIRAEGFFAPVWLRPTGEERKPLL